MGNSRFAKSHFLRLTLQGNESEFVTEENTSNKKPQRKASIGILKGGKASKGGQNVSFIARRIFGLYVANESLENTEDVDDETLGLKVTKRKK